MLVQPIQEFGVTWCGVGRTEDPKPAYPNIIPLFSCGKETGLIKNSVCGNTEESKDQARRSESRRDLVALPTRPAPALDWTSPRGWRPGSCGELSPVGARGGGNDVAAARRVFGGSCAAGMIADRISLIIYLLYKSAFSDDNRH